MLGCRRTKICVKCLARRRKCSRRSLHRPSPTRAKISRSFMVATRCAANLILSVRFAGLSAYAVHASLTRCTLTSALWAQTDSCEKTLTIAIAKPDAGKEPDHNPAGPVVDKCDKAWWYAHKANQNETCQRDCGWVVDWKGMGTSVVPHPKPPAPPPVKKGSGAGALIGVVLVVAALVRTFVFRLPAAAGCAPCSLSNASG